MNSLALLEENKFTLKYSILEPQYNMLETAKLLNI